MGQADGEKGGKEDRVNVDAISAMLHDYSSSDIKVFLQKIWLSSFHRNIMENCNGGTKEHMDELLKAESDWATLQIIYNSFNNNDMNSATG